MLHLWDGVVMIYVVCLQAIMEEADLRLAETKKESYEFDRDIMKNAASTTQGKVVAEKIVRYFEDRIRSRVRQVPCI